MPGPTRKPPDRRHRRGQAKHHFNADITDVPRVPAGLLKQTREWWETFWNSELSNLVDVDLAPVTRLALLLDERERCYRVSRKERVVVGSKGQLVLNPLYRHMAILDGEILQLEDRFGLSPRARQNLGIVVGPARTLEDLFPTKTERDRVDPRLRGRADLRKVTA